MENRLINLKKGSILDKIRVSAKHEELISQHTFTEVFGSQWEYKTKQQQDVKSRRCWRIEKTKQLISLP